MSGASPSATAKVAMTSNLGYYVWDPYCGSNSTSCISINWSSGNPSNKNGAGNTTDIVNSIGSTPGYTNYAAYQCHIYTGGGVQP